MIGKTSVLCFRDYILFSVLKYVSASNKEPSLNCNNSLNSKIDADFTQPNPNNTSISYDPNDIIEIDSFTYLKMKSDLDNAQEIQNFEMLCWSDLHFSNIERPEQILKADPNPLGFLDLGDSDNTRTFFEEAPNKLSKKTEIDSEFEREKANPADFSIKLIFSNTLAARPPNLFFYEDSNQSVNIKTMPAHGDSDTVAVFTETNWINFQIDLSELTSKKENYPALNPDAQEFISKLPEKQIQLRDEGFSKRDQGQASVKSEFSTLNDTRIYDLDVSLALETELQQYSTVINPKDLVLFNENNVPNALTSNYKKEETFNASILTLVNPGGQNELTITSDDTPNQNNFQLLHREEVQNIIKAKKRILIKDKIRIKIEHLVSNEDIFDQLIVLTINEISMFLITPRINYFFHFMNILHDKTNSNPNFMKIKQQISIYQLITKHLVEKLPLFLDNFVEQQLISPANFVLTLKNIEISVRGDISIQKRIALLKQYRKINEKMYAFFIAVLKDTFRSDINQFNSNTAHLIVLFFVKIFYPEVKTLINPSIFILEIICLFGIYKERITEEFELKIIYILIDYYKFLGFWFRIDFVHCTSLINFLKYRADEIPLSVAIQKLINRLNFWAENYY